MESAWTILMKYGFHGVVGVSRATGRGRLLIRWWGIGMYCRRELGQHPESNHCLQGAP